ncbi:proton-conducting transporter transmembrane domain-containing protein [Microbulbifer sp.]|uniref:proton-conducting transporter transmembrane domain-containing protein n=1 Tax=Microbulbifer sp. TaxID=1908541 RepID=UPI003F675347
MAPVLVPLSSLLLCALLRGHLVLVKYLSFGGALLLLLLGLRLVWLAAGGTVLAGQVGGWPAPFGISLVIDRLSAAMIAISALIGLVTLAYGVVGEGAGPRVERDFHLFVQGLLTGICGAFVTADIFNLYVWVEVLLVAAFALMSLGGGARRLAGSMIYVALNLFATMIFLLAAGLVYGASGTLNMGELAVQVRAGSAPPGVTPALALMLLAFSIKAALFPLFGWLPATYHVAMTAVSAMFAGLLTKVGVYTLIRLVTLLWPDYGPLQQLLLWVSCATMLVGVLGAAAQTEVRRILSFHIVSQVGYMVLGLALATPLALAGSVFYVIHHIVVKANLFFIGGMAARYCGSERLAAMGSLYARQPWLALLFAIPALSLVGVPPLSGFWAKFLLVQASLDAAAWWPAGIALLTGLFTLLSMNKIWNEAFLKVHPHGGAGLRRPLGLRAAWVGTAGLALLTVSIGLGAGPVVNYALDAAAQLAEPEAYLRPFAGGAETEGSE